MKILTPIAQSIILVGALALTSCSTNTETTPKKILTELGEKNNIEFTFTKDGGVFTPENIAKYDAFFFYTTGDLTEPGSDKNPPMSKAGKAAFLEAIHNGKGFIGTH